MRFKNGEIAIIVSILLFSSTAHTAGGYVNFMGQVVAPSCTVTGTSSSNVDITLDKINESILSKLGSTAEAARFSIGLSACYPSVKSTQVSFDGIADRVNNALLKVTGGAKGVAVGLYESDGITPLSLFAKTKALDVTGDKGIFNFVAKYVATSSTVAAGGANSSATFVIAYQ